VEILSASFSQSADLACSVVLLETTLFGPDKVAGRVFPVFWILLSGVLPTRSTCPVWDDKAHGQKEQNIVGLGLSGWFVKHKHDLWRQIWLASGSPG
jgi:hypothetical protein